VFTFEASIEVFDDDAMGICTRLVDMMTFVCVEAEICIVMWRDGLFDLFHKAAGGDSQTRK
jgi:hypothetical protein